jgi:hypothetical protein
LDGAARDGTRAGDRGCTRGQIRVRYRASRPCPLGDRWVSRVLEATANELFQDADDRHGITDDGYLVPLDEATVGAMAAWWQGTDGLRGMNVLGKWELLLVCAGKHALNRGAAPYQDAQFVVRLRNAVVHYRSENVSADSTHDMEAWLRGKFDDSRLMVGSGNPWWPDHCLGHGCAAWATRSAVAFADRVSDELGLRPNYRRVCP